MIKGLMVVLGTIGCLSGCAGLQQVGKSRELMVACSAADAVTTGVVLHKGAVEANPLAKLLMKPLGFTGYGLVTIGLTWWLWDRNRGVDNEVNSAVRCGAAVSNLKLL